MKKNILSAVFAVSAMLFSACSGTQSGADTVVYGSIFTANAQGDFAQAAVIKDGRYLFVGDSVTAQSYLGRNTQVVRGGFVMPAGVESHAHYLLEEAFKQGLYIDCYLPDGTKKPIAQMAEEIAAYRQQHPELTGIFGYGWNKFLLIHDGEMIARQDIDRLVSDIPVYIAGRDLHSGWCNTKCLEMAGVLRGGCPTDGVDMKQGVATGYIKDEACGYVRNKVFGQVGDYEASLQSVQRILYAKGYTMLLDPWSNFDGTDAMYRALVKAEAEGKLKMNIFTSYCINTYDDMDREIANAAQCKANFSQGHTAAKYIKLFADGVEDANTAFMLEKYCDQDTYGTRNWEPEQMNLLVNKANAAGLLVHVHAYGDGSAQETVEAYRLSADAHGTRFRNSLAHAPYVTQADLRTIAQYGIGISGSGTWVVNDEPVEVARLIKALGEERYRQYYMIDAFVQHGIKAGMSTDRPCGDGYAEDVFDYMGVLTTGVDYRNGDDQQPRREGFVSVADAARMMTINGAWSLDADTDRGSIEVGKYADFILADGNPFQLEQQHQLNRIHQINVTRTYFEGECVYTLDR